MTETALTTTPKRSLWDLLVMQNELDQGISQIDETALMEMLRAELPQKVDSCAHFYHRVKSSIDYLKAREEEFRSSRKAMENAWETFKSRLTETMLAQGFEKLPGKDYRVQIQNSPEAVDYAKTPDPMDLVDFGDFVKIKYEWNGDAIKEALKSGKEFPFARLKRGQHVRFYVNKEKA